MKKVGNKYEPNIEFGDKIFNGFLKVMMGVSFSSLVGIVFQALGLTSIGWYIGASMVCIPSTYVGMTYLKNRIDKKFALDMSRSDQLIKSLTEIGSYDRTIELGKTFFWNEITLAARKRGVSISNQDMNTLNQLLFMINENYYDIICQTISLSRDELISKVLDIAVYYIESNKDNLDEKDVEEIIKSMFFIDSELKQKMIKEFKNGKCIMNNQTDYRIISKNAESTRINLAHLHDKKEDFIPFFDYDDRKEYQLVISRLIEKDFFKKYGDPNLIKWNVDLLKEIMSMIIVEFDEDLKVGVEDYAPIDFVTSFLYNLGIYCLVNGRYEVSAYEIANVFKHWNIVPFNLKLSMVNRIFGKYQLDMGLHPFEIKSIHHEDLSKKIITFPKNGTN